ncbi:hypothetical protein [Amphibacillus indicireducens]|uniref:Lipoprotein n=1 Tax=Amphibacillus indicireducens TaxID=1076330 RepID=A0ABP7VZM3_9BACI
MKKQQFVFVLILFLIIILSAGCTSKNNNVATLRVNQDSNYVETFEDLSLGNIFDFEFTLPEAENKWVNLWVDSYVDGVKQADPLISLNYGNSLNEADEGHLGFALVTLDSADLLAILYAPGVSGRGVIERNPQEGVISSFEIINEQESIEIKTGEPTILAVYRETTNHSIRTVNLKDAASVEQIIKQDDLVYLLKIKIEEE